MPDLLRLIDKSDIVFNKIKNIGDNIKKQMITESLSETEAFILFRDEVVLFINSLISPTTKFKEFSKAPLSKDINNITYGIWNDLNNLYNYGNKTVNILEVIWQKTNIENTMMVNMENYLSKRIDELQDRVNENFKDNGYYIFIEDFINYNNMDIDMIDGQHATIDTLSGAMLLNIIYSENINQPYCKINGNGFPGNTHVAKVRNNNIVYDGENDAHIDIRNIIDDEHDSWFEYEGIYIKENELEKTKNHGFKYKENISWLFNNDILYIDIILTYNTKQTINNILVDPFLNIANVYSPAILKSIIIDDGYGNYNELIENDIKLMHEQIFIFAPQKIKTITIHIEQKKSYKTLIGHNYFIGVENDKSALEIPNENGERVEGENHSIKYLGIKYDNILNIFKQPDTNDNYNIENTDILFTLPKANTNIVAGVELLYAYRYSIGIRSIKAGFNEYSLNSTYISKQFTFIEEVNYIILETIDDSGLGIIEYKYSIDNGKTWSLITPGEETNILSSKNIRILINISRPSDIDNAKYITPIIYQYKLKGRI